MVRVAFRILSNIHDGALLGKLALTIFTNKLHCRCSIGLWICLRLKVMSLWGVDGLQLYRICSRRPDFSTWGNCSPWDFDYNNIQNTNIFGGAIENSLTSKWLLFTPGLTLDEYSYRTYSSLDLSSHNINKTLADVCSRIFTLYSCSI